MRTVDRLPATISGIACPVATLPRVPNPDDDATTPVEAPQRPVATWVKRTALVLMALLAVYAVYRNYEALRDDLDKLSPWVIVAAFVPTSLAMLTALQVWRVLMGELGSPLPFRPSARIFYISQLGKYVPGTLWSVMGQMELGREFKVPRRTSVTVGALVLALSAVGGVSVGVVLLPFGGSETTHEFWWLVLVLPVAYICLHPPVLRAMLNTLLRLVRQPTIETLPEWPGLRRALFFQVVTWLLLGAQVWILLLGLGAPAAPSLPLAVGGYALAYSLGMLAFVLPAGAGVREATLVLALSPVVSNSTALLVALLARAISTVCDVLFAGFEMGRWRRTNVVGRVSDAP